MGLRESYYRKKWRIDIFIFNHVMSFNAENERRASTWKGALTSSKY